MSLQISDKKNQIWSAVFDALSPVGDYSLTSDGAAYSRQIRDSVAQRFVDEERPISRQEISSGLSDMYCRGFLETDRDLRLRIPSFRR